MPKRLTTTQKALLSVAALGVGIVAFDQAFLLRQTGDVHAGEPLAVDQSPADRAPEPAPPSREAGAAGRASPPAAVPQNPLSRALRELAARHPASGPVPDVFRAPEGWFPATELATQAIEPAPTPQDGAPRPSDDALRARRVDEVRRNFMLGSVVRNPQQGDMASVNGVLLRQGQPRTIRPREGVAMAAQRTFTLLSVREGRRGDRGSAVFTVEGPGLPALQVELFMDSPEAAR